MTILYTFLLTYYLLTYLLKSNPGTRIQQPGTGFRFQNRLLRQITTAQQQLRVAGACMVYKMFLFIYCMLRAAPL